MFGRKKIAALVAEFLGTGLLTLLILSVQRSQLGLQYFVAIAAGLTIALMTFVVGRSSGGFFNPAITLGLWTARKLSTLATIAFMVVQFAGAYVAYVLYEYFANTHLSSVGGHYTGRILIAEAIGTGVFAFAYTATLAKANNQGTRSAFAGLSYTLGVLVASSAALGLLNPAVALGIKSWVWGTYVLGPVIGAIIGINLYSALYEDSPTTALASAGKLVSSATSANSQASKKKSSKK